MVKQLLATALFLFTTLLTFAQGFSTNDPVAYNNYIVSEQSNLMSKVVEHIVQTVHNNNYREVESKRLEVIGQIETSIEKLEGVKPFKGDNSMKEEALAVCKLYYEAYVNDYSKINMLKRNRESSYDAMEGYFDAQDKAEEKLKLAAERFSNAQKSFANTHNMSIEAQSDETIHNISQVMQYSREVFLEFFRVSKMNALCLDRLNEQNAAKLEVCRLNLLEKSNASHERLQQMESFKDGEDFHGRTLAYINYHRLFANTELKELAEILAIENRTPGQVARYNAIIQQYNRDIQILIENFNEAHLHILRKYIPNTNFKVSTTKQ